MIKSKLRIQLAINEMKQNQLAEMTGIRPSTISSIVNGTIKQYPLDALNKMCSVLNCSVGDLLEYVPDDETKEV